MRGRGAAAGLFFILLSGPPTRTAFFQPVEISVVGKDSFTPVDFGLCQSYSCAALGAESVSQNRSVFAIIQLRDYILFAVAGPMVVSFVAWRSRNMGRNLVIGGIVAMGIIYADQSAGANRKLRTFDLREWTVMEGSLTLKVNFSDQTLELS